MTVRRLPGGDLWKYYLGFALARIATIAALPIVAHIVGPERYGFFEATVSVMLGAMILGDAGVGAAMVRFAGDDRFAASDIVRAAAKIQLAASVLAATVATIPLVVVAPPDSSLAVILLALATFTVVEGFATLGAGIVRAEQDNALYLKTASVRLVSATAIAAIGASVGGVEGALFGIALAGVSFAIVALRAIARTARTAAKPTRAAQRQILRYSLPLMLTSLTTWTLSLSDRVFLRALSSPLDLAQYSASYRTGSVVALFVAGPLALAWIPAARAARDVASRNRQTERWSLALAWASLGAGTLVVIASGIVVPLAFGSGFDDRAGVVAVVVISGWLSGLYVLVSTDILISDETGRLAPVMVSVALINLVLNWIFISAWDGTGAAVATGLSYAALPVATALVVPRSSLAWLLTRRHLATVGFLVAAVAAAAVEPALAIAPLAAAIGVSTASRPARNG